MGLQIRSDLYQATQQKTYEAGVASGTRRRKPGGGSKGKLPTMADKLLFVLYYYKIYPTFDVLGTQFDMVRSKANENLHKLSPILYDALVYLELMPYRELSTPADLKAALQGMDQVIIDATGTRLSSFARCCMAAGLTDHVWTMDELLSFRVPPDSLW